MSYAQNQGVFFVDFYERYLELCKENGYGKTTAALKIGIPKSTASEWSRGHVPSVETITKLANLFGVSVDYLLGKTEIKNPPEQQTPEEIAKVALFGGAGEVTDAMWQEVVEFAKYVEAREAKKRSEQ